MALCPHCSSPRAGGSECPRCGVVYAKAEARLAHAAPIEVAAAPEEAAGWSEEIADAQLERRLRAWAIPAALFVSWLLVTSGVGHFIVRTFFSMWVHEIGHALTAWLCGFLAFPGPWFTPTAAERSSLFPLLITAGLVWGAVQSWRAERRRLAAALAVVLVVQIVWTTLLSVDAARALIAFGGDGGCLVLGTLSMLSVYAPADSAIRRGWLRWGFLVIGAASFADAFEQWWAARTDVDRIPFGMNEGVGLSDPSVLLETYGWSTSTIVHGYVALGVVCGTVLVLVYLVDLVRGRRPAAGSPD